MTRNNNKHHNTSTKFHYIFLLKSCNKTLQHKHDVFAFFLYRAINHYNTILCFSKSHRSLMLYSSYDNYQACGLEMVLCQLQLPSPQLHLTCMLSASLRLLLYGFSSFFATRPSFTVVIRRCSANFSCQVLNCI